MRKIFQLPKIFGKWRSLSFAWFSSRRASRMGGVVHGFGDSFDQDIVTVGNVDWNYGKRIPGRRPSESAVRIKKTALENAARSKFAVVVSKSLKRDVMELCPQFPENRLRVIYPGVNVEKFNPSRRSELRKRLSLEFGIPENTLWVACAAGGDFEKRNLKTLGDALARLEGRKDWSFVFAGAGKGQFPWPDQITSRSFFLGPVAELSDILPACDIFAYPAWFDEFAMVCSEAMASGLPVILSRSTGASEIITEPEDIVADPADAEAISRRIQFYLDSAEARRRTGEKNRQGAQSLSWPKIYTAYAELYAEISGERAS